MGYGEQVVTESQARRVFGEENYKAGLGIPSCLYAKNIKQEAYLHGICILSVLDRMCHATSSLRPLPLHIRKPNILSYPTTMTKEECSS
jgi:hypothetical protein